jgi:hypothetical protein
MQITQSPIDTGKSPADWFTGDVTDEEDNAAASADG